MVNKVCNLYNNCNNIQKHLTLILLQSHWPFLLPLLLWLCPPSLISFLHLIWDFSSHSIFQLNSYRTYESPSILPAWVTSFVWRASALISALLTHKFISSCLFYLLSSSARVLICILSMVSNLSTCAPCSDLPLHVLGVSAHNFFLHEGQGVCYRPVPRSAFP